MAKLTKKAKALQGAVESTKLYAVGEALGLVQKHATAKFDESIDVAVQLGVDAKKSDQVVRGAVVLPNGTGKSVRVAVFAQGAKAEEAKAAGAEVVGMDDLAAQVKAGDMPFKVVQGLLENTVDEVEVLAIQAAKNGMPAKVDMKFWDKFVEEVYLDNHNSYYR